MSHWEYILPAVSGPLGLAAWRYAPRAFLMMVGGLTKNSQRSKQCAEMVRLSRKDAKDLPSYLAEKEEPAATGGPSKAAAWASPKPSGYSSFPSASSGFSKATNRRARSCPIPSRRATSAPKARPRSR